MSRKEEVTEVEMTNYYDHCGKRRVSDAKSVNRKKLMVMDWRTYLRLRQKAIENEQMIVISQDSGEVTICQ